MISFLSVTAGLEKSRTLEDLVAEWQEWTSS